MLYASSVGSQYGAAPLMLFDPAAHGCPIVDVSKGLCDVLSRTQNELIGATYSDLLQGLPSWAISRSGRENFESFCCACRMDGVIQVGETSIVQVIARSDGSSFTGHLTLGLCPGSCRILGVLLVAAADSASPVQRQQQAALRQQAHALLREAQSLLSRRSEAPSRSRWWSAVFASSSASAAEKERPGPVPLATFYSTRIQDQAVLLDGGHTAMRREAEQVATGCLVVSAQRLQKSVQGLVFAVRVMGVSNRFRGLPLLGFTRRRPVDEPGLYPAVAQCLAESVFIGGSCQAFARDQKTNFEMGFRQPPPSEVQTWSAPEAAGANVQLQIGDVLECSYLWEGHLQLRLNGTLLVQFDIERPLKEWEDYYAVADVSGRASTLSLVPNDNAPTANHLLLDPPLGVTEKCSGVDDASTCASDGWRGSETSATEPEAPLTLVEDRLAPQKSLGSAGGTALALVLALLTGSGLALALLQRSRRENL
mmetsp:Transcript_103222/g.205163  ORF Transcript_103222/g.205163 Transcript_103222/m.205163 type:complete len:481 (+) Transcript_103222:68-1510(+)|eukprot:CAMPEP_0172713232 /NCGR_PEP_ID=MMETSP1074-20121228/61743_1 /TAXON_ID=2916 /ORGANISM="Ceratium fusus, Strain PA161109" /LENGTH=480 /DNA_ID=CAMNT_0013537279 /DNA_START=65 /DNA_END=1507 /DNA_ORIENTATION=+